jgi:uncharacterized membrane protein YedE/YeeE
MRGEQEMTVAVQELPALQATSRKARRSVRLLLYLLVGVTFGITLVRGEVVSWFRIQEMFRFHSFHMFGILGSAIAVAAAGIALLRRTRTRALSGEAIAIPPKTLERGAQYLIGGTLFGIGWSFTGACPGPLIALVGYGVATAPIVLAAAIGGTWLYGVLRPRLPH